MDLRERTSNVVRHPWETARFTAVDRILDKFFPDAGHPAAVVDVGCGDAWLLRQLAGTRALRLAHGYDRYLTDPEIALAPSGPVTLFNKEELLAVDYDLALMLDVLEHVENDAAFLKNFVKDHVLPGGIVLITVPAHQALFSAHDVFLKHFRRYDQRSLRAVVAQAGLETIGEGALFFSLLLPRVSSCLKEKWTRTIPGAGTELGRWQHGPVLSRLVETVLTLDNAALLRLSQWHVPTEGLTRWIVARKRA